MLVSRATRGRQKVWGWWPLLKYLLCPPSQQCEATISNTGKLHFNKLHELWYLIQSPRLEYNVHLEMGLPCTVETHSLLGIPFGVYQCPCCWPVTDASFEQAKNELRRKWALWPKTVPSTYSPACCLSSFGKQYAIIFPQIGLKLICLLVLSKRSYPPELWVTRTFYFLIQFLLRNLNNSPFQIEGISYKSIFPRS